MSSTGSGGSLNGGLAGVRIARSIGEASGSNSSAAGSAANLTHPGATQAALKVMQDQKMAAALRNVRDDIEHKAALQRKLQHFDQEEANLREAALMEARNLYEAQLTERRLSEMRQRELATDLLAAEFMKVRLAKLADRALTLKVRLVQQEEAREREVAFRQKMRQKREAFQLLIKNVEARQKREREELRMSQLRVAKNIKLIQALEMRGLDEIDRRRKLKENEVVAHQLRMKQQKETEQLRELQLIKIKHMTETLAREIEDQAALEHVATEHKEKELALEAQFLSQQQAAQDEMDNAQARIKATHLRERQKATRSSFERQQRRQASFLERQQRHSAKLRTRVFMAQDELLQKSSGIGDEDSEDSSSMSGTESSDAASDSEEQAGGDGEHAGHEKGGDGEKRVVKSKNLDDAQELELMEQLEKGRDRVRTLQRQQKENLDSLKNQQRDQFRMLQKEQKRKFSDLIKEQEEEVAQIRADHQLEMNELLATMSRNDIIESQKRQVEKKLDTDSSNDLLSAMLPKFICDQLKQGIMPEPVSFDFACVGFMDLYGFKELASAAGTGHQLVKLLDRLYKCFDAILVDYPTLYKVETVQDTFMVACGVLDTRDSTPIDQRIEFARAILEFSMDAIDAVAEIDVSDLKLPGTWKDGLPLRIGLNCGPCLAGLVGSKAPRYCLFGDVVNVASRMCSTNDKGRIQVSDEFHKVVAAEQDFVFVERGSIAVKGKGTMLVWVLEQPPVDGGVAQEGAESETDDNNTMGTITPEPERAEQHHD
ncbi:hypothetical protein GGF31_005335 [Allomyces arbusculus]|nr:hypothetical protein GGF31_005335 [Allomyces arbusculus]